MIPARGCVDMSKCNYVGSLSRFLVRARETALNGDANKCFRCVQRGFVYLVDRRGREHQRGSTTTN